MTPAANNSLDHTTESCLLSSGPSTPSTAAIIISRLNSTAYILAVYASQGRSPATTQDSLPGGVVPFPGQASRLRPPARHVRRFVEVMFTFLFILFDQAFPWRTLGVSTPFFSWGPACARFTRTPGGPYLSRNFDSGALFRGAMAENRQRARRNAPLEPKHTHALILARAKNGQSTGRAWLDARPPSPRDKVLRVTVDRRATSLRLGEGRGLGAFTDRGEEFNCDEGVGDHGEDFAPTTAPRALQNVDFENAFQQLRPFPLGRGKWFAALGRG
jgi:hypothetical protein